jgi:hypothetical protein
MASKSALQAELAIEQQSAHRQWLKLNERLIAVTDDAVVINMCRELSATFRRCAAIDGQISTNPHRLAMTSELSGLESKLTQAGWK